MLRIFSGINSIREYTWSVLEVYGWFIIFGIAAVYVIYKKYIYDLLEKKKLKQQLGDQKKFDNEASKENEDRVRNARLKQQDSLNAAELEAKLRKEAKEKIELEKKIREASVLDTAIGKFEKKKREPVKVEEKQNAEEILAVLIESKPIIVFTKTFCPFSRKIRQLIATYRLSPDMYEFIDLDEEEKDENVPATEIQAIFEKRYGKKSVPKMFINGDYIGGYEEIIEFSKQGSFEGHFS